MKLFLKSFCYLGEKSVPKCPIKNLGKMAIFTCSLEMQIPKTRFPSDLAITGYSPAEMRAISVIALAWDRPGKLGVYISETKAGSSVFPVLLGDPQ